MTYAAFQKSQKSYLEAVTPQGTADSIPLLPEKYYGDSFTVRLLDSDGIQERLDMMRAEAGIDGRPFDEMREKGKIIREITGDLTREARLEYDKFIPAQNPEKLLKDLSGFYAAMTGRPLAEACRTPEGEADIKKLLGRDSLDGVSDLEKAAALTSVQKSRTMLEMQDLRNTNTSAGYHIITVENKAANPLGFYMSRIDRLPEEKKEKLAACADRLLPVTHDGGAWHEMTHALGTDDESKCEGFRFLKTLKEYREPALVYPDINARLYNNLNTLETIRKDARKGETTLNGNFRYIMPKMMLHIMENADILTAETRNMTDAQVMKKNREIVDSCAYGAETEKAFRRFARECETPEALAAALRGVYKNGPENPETGALYPLVNDFIQAAHHLNPSVPLEEMPDRFFAAENFMSQSRDIGKAEIREAARPELTADEKKRCQELYDTVCLENPQVSGSELDKLFARAIVRDAWQQKAAVEADLENPAKAKDILFSREKAAEYTDRINGSLVRSRNAAGIVRTYGAEFEKGVYRAPAATDRKKVPLQTQLTRAERRGKRTKAPLQTQLTQVEQRQDPAPDRKVIQAACVKTVKDRRSK